MKPEKRTKIVATIGPASRDESVLREMILAGMNVARMNFSHDEHSSHLQVIENVRKLDEELGTNTALLADLQGPKLRIGDVEGEGVEIEDGQTIEITTRECIGTASKLYTNYANFPEDVNPGERVLLDDGKIALEVMSSDNKHTVKLKVINGGLVKSKKGINLPNTKVSLPCLTEKDLGDLDFALSHDVDWIGLSFVRSHEDVVELRNLIDESGKHSRIIAKIEKPEALEDIDNIIRETDGVMVARGDLGVEIPMQNVPIMQKRIINRCLKNSKPVIVATQMMETMIENSTPTRAEVNDVANAVLDGADAVMLSAETSVGKYPVEVIETMSTIVREVEQYDDIYHHEEAPVESDEARFISDSICYNACRLAARTDAEAIITMTFSGYTGFKVSSQRPKAHVYVFTGNKKILSLMNLVWGVKAFYYDKMVSTDHTIADIKYLLSKDGFIEEGDMIINIASMPIAEKGMSNMIRLTKV